MNKYSGIFFSTLLFVLFAFNSAYSDVSTTIRKKKNHQTELSVLSFYCSNSVFKECEVEGGFNSGHKFCSRNRTVHLLYNGGIIATVKAEYDGFLPPEFEILTEGFPGAGIYQVKVTEKKNRKRICKEASSREYNIADSGQEI